ncbi:hypothetical protein C8R43DRAFT_1137745 [Mycena crocata]|nr:hypothetical protein C8R43DRAFT_1137745 [Mycena crocata]
MDQIPHMDSLAPYVRWHVFHWLKALRTTMFNRLPLGFPFSDVVIRETFKVAPDSSHRPYPCRVTFRYSGSSGVEDVSWTVIFEHIRIGAFILPREFFDDPLLPFTINADFVLSAMMASVAHPVDTPAMLTGWIEEHDIMDGPAVVRHMVQSFHVRAVWEWELLIDLRAARWMQKCIACGRIVSYPRLSPCCASPLYIASVELGERELSNLEQLTSSINNRSLHCPDASNSH